MLSKELELIINKTFRNAKTKQHQFMTIEHLLLSLLDDRFCVDALSECGTNVDELRDQLDKFINETTPLITTETSKNEVTQPTLAFQRVLQRAVFHVQSAGLDEVIAANILVAIFSEEDSLAFHLLSQQGLKRSDLINYIQNQSSEYSDIYRSNPNIVFDEGTLDNKGLSYEIVRFRIDNVELKKRVHIVEQQLKDLKIEINKLRQDCGK